MVVRKRGTHPSLHCFPATPSACPYKHIVSSTLATAPRSRVSLRCLLGGGGAGWLSRNDPAKLSAAQREKNVQRAKVRGCFTCITPSAGYPAGRLRLPHCGLPPPCARAESALVIAVMATLLYRAKGCFRMCCWCGAYMASTPLATTCLCVP